MASDTSADIIMMLGLPILAVSRASAIQVLG